MSTFPETLEIPVLPRLESLSSYGLKAFAATVLGTLLLAAIAVPQGDPQDIVWTVLGSAIASAIVTIPLFAYHRQSQRPGVLRIEPDQVIWRDAVLGGEVTLPYRELWSARKEGRGRWESLVLRAGATSRVRIPTAFLPEAGTADSILETVRERISYLPEKPQRPPRARMSLKELASIQWKTATFAVSAFLAGVFLAELATGALAHPALLQAFGASSSALVKHGELFRLATANFLHASLEQIVMTLVPLLLLGSILEPRLGPGRFLTIFLGSALAGTAGSAFLGNQVFALGASTGIAGLVGACAMIAWRWPGQLSPPGTKWNWIVVAVISIGHLLEHQSFDYLGHLLGLLAGAALMLPEHRTVALTELANRRRALFRVTAALLVAVFLAAGGIALRRADRHSVQRGAVERHPLKHGLGEQVALVQMHAQVVEPAKFIDRLHSLDDNVDAKIATDLDNGARDGLTGAMKMYTSHQVHVQLDDIRLELGKQDQSGVSGSKIVDRKLHPGTASLTEDFRKICVIIDRQFDNDSLQRKQVSIRSLDRGIQTDGYIKDCAAQKVEIEMGVHSNSSRDFNRLGAASCVKRLLLAT